ncbi:MAG: terpene cyclase/mutase family protein [Kiritimatiellae bacterium]|nr:terpene cyclase/mutase family protein [Kiritimatiellia bacterium]
MKLNRLVLSMFVVSMLMAAGAHAENSKLVDAALAEKIDKAIARGVDWLKQEQQEGGGWSNTNFPALTAFPVWAMARSEVKGIESAQKKAIGFLLDCVHTDGAFKGAIFRPVAGVKGGGLMNYNTAICMTALHACKDPGLVPVVLDARSFMVKSQHAGSTLHNGGMGYDPPTGRSYADLSNSYIGYEAMRLTQDVEDLRPGKKKVAIDWEAAIRFIQHCHNDPQFNELSWASSDLSEKGGFAYRPDEYRKNSGAYKDKDGVLKFRSMPGMSYAGLLSYIYARVNRGDPRIQATVKWITANWQLEKANRNPEMAGKPEEKEGLFYMYNVMAKGLHAYGQEALELSDGSKIRWRDELARRILSLQSSDGFWINENGRYWESDKVLVTSYTLLALETIMGR